MELRHLRYCIAVAEEGSFTKAAVRLRLAQQAISRQIADLERELGVRLFDRGARGARLTPAGAAFVEEAKLALGQTMRAAQRARSQTTSGQLRIAYSYLTPSHFGLVGGVITSFHQASPNLAVDVRHLSTHDQRAALLDGTIDIGFGYMLGSENGDIISELFRNDPLSGVILRTDHPLARKEPIWLKDLASLPLLMLAREANPLAYDGALAELADRGLHPEIATVHAIGVPSLLLVAQGCCWKLASETIAEEIGPETGVVFRRFADSPLPFGLWVRRHRHNASLTAQQFAAICREMSGATAKELPRSRPPGLHKLA